MELTPQQKERLAKYLELSKYENGCYTFGPILRKDAQELYEIFTSVKIGYYASYVDRTVVNSDNSPIFVYAAYNQATKLLKIVSEMLGKPLLADPYFAASSKEKDSETVNEAAECTEASQTSLSADWSRPEEDKAWKHLNNSKDSAPKKRGRPKKDQILSGLSFDFSDMLKR